jgi:hypothetical protein
MDTYSTPGEAIRAGIIVFAILAIFGLRLLYRGLRGDVLDASGNPVAGRMWFIGGGLTCLLVFIAFMIFIWQRGFFGRGT